MEKGETDLVIQYRKGQAVLVNRNNKDETTADTNSLSQKDH